MTWVFSGCPQFLWITMLIWIVIFRAVDKYLMVILTVKSIIIRNNLKKQIE